MAESLLAPWWPEIARWSPQEIVFGLGRMQAMLKQVDAKTLAPAITVGGTNGKGSSVALLAAIYQHAGFRVGAYFSPHLWEYRERFRINGQLPEETALASAFATIAKLRQDLPLTYFEVATLAAFILFRDAKCDLMILEVGLGGRLDAVNVLDPLAALVTNIGFDHQQWLGDTLDAIAWEKAAIFRPQRPAIVAMAQAPAPLYDQAAALQADLYRYPQDFFFERHDDKTWDWFFTSGCGLSLVAYKKLPAPALAGDHQYQNAAAVLMLTQALQNTFPVTPQALAAGLQSYFLPGRLQTFRHRQGGFWLVADVAHNQEATGVLAAYLQQLGDKPWLAVFGALSDKPLPAMLKAFSSQVQVAKFYLGLGLPSPRAATLAQYQAAFAAAGLPQPEDYPEVCQALSKACVTLRQDFAAYQGIVLWGSFYTLAAAKDCLLVDFIEEKLC